MSKPDIVSKSVAVEVIGDMVRIDLITGDEYAAQVLYDDLIEKFRSGVGVQLKLRPNDETVAVEEEPSPRS